MAIIALCGQKGGSGKTTAATSIAGELVDRGLEVLLIDADPQGSATTWGNVAYELGNAKPDMISTEGRRITPAFFDQLAAPYEMTVIDCPPRHDAIQRAALMACDLAVLPCGPSTWDAWAMTESVELVTEAQALRPELIAYALITRRIAGTNIGAEARKVIRQAGLPVLRSELGLRVAYQEAPAAGLGAAQYAPNDAAGAEVRALVTELLRRINGKKAHHRAAKTKARVLRAG